MHPLWQRMKAPPCFVSPLPSSSRPGPPLLPLFPPLPSSSRPGPPPPPTLSLLFLFPPSLFPTSPPLSPILPPHFPHHSACRSPYPTSPHYPPKHGSTQHLPLTLPLPQHFTSHSVSSLRRRGSLRSPDPATPPCGKAGPAQPPPPPRFAPPPPALPPPLLASAWLPMFDTSALARRVARHV